MSSKRRIRRHACSSKVRYPEMWRAMIAMRKARARGVKVSAYGCKFCGGFHIGHTPYRVKQAMAARREAQSYQR